MRTCPQRTAGGLSEPRDAQQVSTDWRPPPHHSSCPRRASAPGAPLLSCTPVSQPFLSALHRPSRKLCSGVQRTRHPRHLGVSNTGRHQDQRYSPHRCKSPDIQADPLSGNRLGRQSHVAIRGYSQSDACGRVHRPGRSPPDASKHQGAPDAVHSPGCRSQWKTPFDRQLISQLTDDYSHYEGFAFLLKLLTYSSARART